MSKIHHSELKDLQAVYARIAHSGVGTRPDGSALTGVDLTYAACFRASHRMPEALRLRGLRDRGVPV